MLFFQLYFLRTRWRRYLTPFQMNNSSYVNPIFGTMWMAGKKSFTRLHSNLFACGVVLQSKELWEYRLRYGIRGLEFRVGFPIDVLVSTCSCCFRPPCHVVARSAKSNVKKRCSPWNSVSHVWRPRLSSILSFGIVIARMWPLHEMRRIENDPANLHQCSMPESRLEEAQAQCLCETAYVTQAG